MSAEDNIFIVKMGFSSPEKNLSPILRISCRHPGTFHFGNPSKILTTFTLTPEIFYCYPHQGCRGTGYIFLF